MTNEGLKIKFLFSDKGRNEIINHLFPVFLPQSRTRVGLKVQWQLELEWLQQEAWNGEKTVYEFITYPSFI